MRIAATVSRYLAWACLAVAAFLCWYAIYIDKLGFPNELDEGTRRTLAAEASLGYFASAGVYLLAAAVLFLVCRTLASRRPT
jgi:hypothetical protein